MSGTHRNTSLRSTRSAASEIVSPLGRLENVNRDNRRTSVISQESVATTGRLLDRLGLDDIDDYEDLESIEEHGGVLSSVDSRHEQTTSTTNYASADKFRSLRPNIMNNSNFRSGKDSAVRTAMAIGSSVHNVHVSKLVVPSTGHRGSLKGIKIDSSQSSSTEDIAHFQGVVEHENGQHPIIFNGNSNDVEQYGLIKGDEVGDEDTEVSENEDTDMRSFEYGDDIEITEATTADYDEDSSLSNHTADNSHIFVNPAYQTLSVDKKPRIKKALHGHSFSNPSDIVPSSWKPKSFVPKSPLTKIFHHKFYHITAPDLVVSNPDDNASLRSPSSSSIFSHSPSSSIHKSHVTIDQISSPIPAVPPSRFHNFPGTLPNTSSHMRAASSDGHYRDIPPPFISHMRTSSAVELENHHEFKPATAASNIAPLNLSHSTYDSLQDKVRPRVFTAPVTYDEDKLEENKLESEKKTEVDEKSPFQNRHKPASIIITDMALPDPVPSPQVPGTPRTRHPYSQYRSGKVSSPGRSMAKRPSPQASDQTLSENSPKDDSKVLSPATPTANLTCTSDRGGSPFCQNQNPNSSMHPTASNFDQNKTFSSLTPEARVSMAIALRKSGQSKDAAYQLQIASNHGSKDAMLLYGLSLRYGYGLRKDEKESFTWICKAGDVTPYKPYRFNVDPRRLEVEKNGEEGIAKENHTLASIMFEIGQAYMYGWGIERDELQGIEFVEKSASLGYVDAMCECGTFWNKKGNNNRKKDMKRAASWFRLSEKFGAKLIGSSWIYKPKYLN